MQNLDPKQIRQNKAYQRRLTVAAIISICLIPVAILCDILLFSDRNYYVVSLVVIFLAMLPFILRFERRKPRSRELVVMAVLIALAVIGRAAFFMIPQFKPVAAIVIITGVSLGAESGFIAGALAGFLSNFIFGHGPWTPWQMFAFGLTGFLAGLLFRKGILSARRIPLCIFGGLTAFLLYGILVDIGSLTMFIQHLTPQTVFATFISGIPFNLIHGVATACFLFFLAEPMTKKLARIKRKYGLLDR